MDTQSESEYVWSNYGAERVPSTTLQRTLDPQLSELLNILVKRIRTLEFRSSEGLDTLRKDTPTPLARRSSFTIGMDGIK